MNRRLYFLLPDTQSAQECVNGLVQQGIPRTRMHAITRDSQPTPSLPQASSHQQSDLGGHLEHILWSANLMLFACALGALVVFGLLGHGYGALASLAIMAASFIAGERFCHVPDQSLAGFRDALQHGEVLLLVDVARTQVGDVSHWVSRYHPEAVTGGCRWQTNMLAL